MEMNHLVMGPTTEEYDPAIFWWIDHEWHNQLDSKLLVHESTKLKEDFPAYEKPCCVQNSSNERHDFRSMYEQLTHQSRDNRERPQG